MLHALCFQVPALSIFETSLRRGKFDGNRKLSNGGMMEFSHIYPMDAVYDTPEDVPEDVSTSGTQLSCSFWLKLAIANQQLLNTAADACQIHTSSWRSFLKADADTVMLRSGCQQQEVCCSIWKGIHCYRGCRAGQKRLWQDRHPSSQSCQWPRGHQAPSGNISKGK